MIAKDSPVRSRVYLAWVRARACQWCRARPPSEASHHPKRGHGSIGAKCCDLRTLPLCHECHRSMHQTGKLGLMTGDQTRMWAEEQITETLRSWVRERMGA